MPSYEIVGGSSAGGSTAAITKRRAPSAGELSLIRDLRDQLKRAKQEVKRITVHVNVAHSKASQAAVAERYLLSEIDSLGNQ
jgi:hypothetical protein